jgi:hypothetical protein
MKLAEALILRADYQKRLEQLRHRLQRHAKVQEGDRPGEQPPALIAEVESISADLERIIRQINATNSTTQMTDGRTIAAALAQRDVLVLRQRIYRDLAEAATITQDRYSRSEVKFRPTVDIGEIQARADNLAREHRELDARIQEANWQFDLRE